MLNCIIFSACSLSSIGAYLFKYNSDEQWSTASVGHFGLFGLLGIGVAMIIEFASKGSSKVRTEYNIVKI